MRNAILGRAVALVDMDPGDGSAEVDRRGGCSSLLVVRRSTNGMVKDEDTRSSRPVKIPKRSLSCQPKCSTDRKRDGEITNASFNNCSVSG